MNSEEITRMLTKIFDASGKYSKGAIFAGVFAKNRLPTNFPHDKPCLLVANTDDHRKPGEHWVAIFIEADRRYAEYFDSFGESPLKEFEDYMSTYADRIVCNEKQIQSVASKFCGHYTIMFCAFRAIGCNVH